MLKNKTIHISIILLVLGFSWASAQVSPEIQLGARGVMSFNIDARAGEASAAINDFSDTALLLGFRQKLYNKFRGQFVVGLQFPVHAEPARTLGVTTAELVHRER